MVQGIGFSVNPALPTEAPKPQSLERALKLTEAGFIRVLGCKLRLGALALLVFGGSRVWRCGLGSRTHAFKQKP